MVRFKIKDTLLLITSIIVIFIVGCAKNKTNTLNVVMGLTEEEWQVMRKYIFPKFERQYGCRIQAYQVEAADWPKKLKAMVAADRVNVDVFSQDNMRLYSLVKDNLIEDLTPYYSQIPKAISPHMRRVGEFAGKIYFFPYRPNVQITFYNEAKFNQYNIQPPHSWGQLLKIAKLFKEKEGLGRVGLKLWGDGPTTTQIYEMIISAGGDPFEFNDQGCIKTFEFLKELYPYLSVDSKKAKWDTTNTYLANGSFYLAQNWPFGINIIVKDYGKKQIKAYCGWQGPYRQAHVIGGEVLGIPKGATHKKLALDFIFYLESKQTQQILVEKLGWPSVRSDAYAQVRDWQKPYFNAVKEALRYGVYRPNVLYWAEFDKFLNEAVTRIIIRQEPLIQVLNEYHEKMKIIIQAYTTKEPNEKI